MLNGQCPYRLLRQVLAEIERRKEALIGAQITHAELVRDIEKNKDSLTGDYLSGIKKISYCQQKRKGNGKSKKPADKGRKKGKDKKPRK